MAKAGDGYWCCGCSCCVCGQRTSVLHPIMLSGIRAQPMTMMMLVVVAMVNRSATGYAH